MIHANLRRQAVLLTLAGAATLLGACSRTDDGRAAGERVDAAANRTEQAAKDAGRTARDAGRDAGEAVGRAADSVGDKTRDAAITAAVNAKLAADKDLSALAINVDTTDGKVVLRGSAPDTAARNRATEIARTVDGVSTVSNDISVQPRAQ